MAKLERLEKRLVECLLNQAWRADSPQTLSPSEFVRAQRVIRNWPNYQPTPLRDLDRTARELSIGGLFYKDESSRFGMGSFKCLGAPYALCRALERSRAAGGWEVDELFKTAPKSTFSHITAVCASDGNHGRALAWACSRLRCRCLVFLPAFVTPVRRRAIEEFGAEVIIVNGTYDEAAALAERAGSDEGCLTISDAGSAITSVAADVMCGYTLIAAEVAAQASEPATHCFIQAGVGGLAAAMADSLSSPDSSGPRIIVVEPLTAAGLFASAQCSRLTAPEGSLETVAGGLACGLPSPLAWEILSKRAFAFMRISDDQIIDAMRYLKTLGIVSGESGAVGLAGLLAACGDASVPRELSLTRDARVLVIGTEGATDPELYAKLTTPAPA